MKGVDHHSNVSDVLDSRIVLASSNPGKIREIQSILSHESIVPQSEFDIDDADETGLTFIENAIIKARHASRHSGLRAIADDSGIEVDALGGAPGVFSARYAGVGATDQQNLQRLLDELEGVAEPQRTARFRCVIAYLRHASDPAPIIAEGVWEGVILSCARGANGFGYDPIFFLPGSCCTSAELSAEQKNRISHRAKALKAFNALLYQ